MTVKIIGAALIVSGCGGFGFKMAANHLKEERSLRKLIEVLDYLECELEYHMTPLPDLCRQAAQQSGGKLKDVLCSLNSELENQISPDVERCMSAALSRHKDLPAMTVYGLELLGKTLGKFDLSGQLKGLHNVRSECERKLADLTRDRDVRVRSYKTLALCAGAALAILFF